jgi:uncharacterized protein YfaS (alpha-2-macroglobulin family)
MRNQITAFVLLLCAILLAPLSGRSASRDAFWKAVEDASNKGLPRTAITNLDLIITAATKEKAWGEAAKAIARKIVFEGNIQGNKAEEKITRIDAEIAKAPAEIKPLLETLRATWYWHYFQQNRWRFARRTQTAEAPGKDFTTWDLPRLFAEIDKHFTAALASTPVLKRTPVATFDQLLEKGNMPDAWRPTLYDFIANEALQFYTSGEQAGAKAEDAFEISADSPMLGSAEDFLAWNPATTDGDSSKLKAIRLYQEVLRFHQRDADVAPFVLVDIERLQWGHSVAFGETKAARYQSALQSIADKNADHELGGYANYRRARQIQAEGDLVEARNIVVRLRGAWKDGVVGRKASNLINEIEAKSVAVSTERVWNAPWPKIEVRYRNVTNIWFRAVAWDWAQFLDKKHSRPEYLNDAERKELMAKAAALEWSAPLPATADFKERVEEFPAPATLKPGFYFLIASHNAAFSDTDNQISYADFFVSDLSLVVRPRNGNIEGFVLQANSGEPVSGAQMNAWHLDNNGNRIAAPETKTDELGFFTLDVKERRGHLVRARHNGHEVASQNEYWSYEQGEPKPHDQTIFFTDRSLYRPGQTVQYKGIVVHTDQSKDSYDTVAGREVEVIFADPNGKEIAKAKHKANDFGSFSGSFTSPRDRVMGRCRIYTRGGADGSAWLNVEEYKRPKFQTTLDAPKVAAKLNDKVSLIGKAESYTGAAVDGAKVKWRVVREVRWPWWWGWYDSWRVRQIGASQEIAHGTATTGTDGTFTIEFVAKPDPQVAEKDEATFSFSIYADVTDGAGETRSANRSVNVGFVALRAMVSADDWQVEEKPVELKISTTTLDGEGQTAEGVVKIHRLKEPAQTQRPDMGEISHYRRGPKDPDQSDPNNWELGDVVEQKGFTTDAEGKAKLEFKLGTGAYRAMLETQDRFGKKVTGRLALRVLKPSDTKLAIKIPHLLAAPEWRREPGQDFTALWGTGYEAGRAFIEIEHRHKMLKRYWTKAGDTQAQIQQAVDESMRGGFTLLVTQVRENRAFLDTRHIDVPWSNKDLDLKWEHFTSKLGPAQKETWTLVLGKGRGTNVTERTVAELAATLYDESLDAYLGHQWMQRLNIFRYDSSSASPQFVNQTKHLQHMRGNWTTIYLNAEMNYRHFPYDLVQNWWGWNAVRFRGMAPASAKAMGGRAGGEQMEYFVNSMDAVAAPAPITTTAGFAREEKAALGVDFETRKLADKDGGAAQQKSPDLSKVTARKNLNETAFFFPQLLADSNGVVKMQFTMPEALTTWKFMGFAHDTKCRSGFLDAKTVTAKDLMVQPNPPRFLREGDTLEFTVKVSNQSAARQDGKVRLAFNDARSEQSTDALLANAAPEQSFDIPAKESRTFSWRIKVPDGAPFLTYKAVASTGRLSDGEEGYLPVLARRIFVTESLPLPIRGKAGGAVTKKFDFDKLLKSGRSSSLVHQNLTVQMVSNPSWYAVMALPYLMEFPHECTEQTFNRFYANSLARSIANGDPKIRRVFDQWKGTPALDSPLEKNQDLKAVMLEETPWLRQANNESQARKNVGTLFDANRLDDESTRTLTKLVEMQLNDGSWPWFPGGRGNDYITLYITTGFGRLRHLGVDIDTKAAVKSLARLDNWMDEHYRDILKWPDPEKSVLSSTDALYLYGRSFFLKDKPIGKQHTDAVEFFLKQARKRWLDIGSRQSQGHVAIALNRFGTDANKSTARDIMKSIKERSVTNEEMGMFWRETELSWWWYRAPIETQALMIEAFDEVMADKPAVEECRVWLLKQKQTQDWKTTKATADAVYALLLRGRDILASDALVEVKLGNIDLTPGHGKPQPRNPKLDTTPEAGTGFYEKRFASADIKPKLGEITVKKLDEGVAWGSVHWQYLEDMSKVTPHEGTPLKLKKALFTKVHTKKGPSLEPAKGTAQVGDELVVRIELRVDRDMEYIHLKDQRGSGTEPVNVLSRYKYQDGLAYYETTRDTASHFFIDYLPKGTYVFEYSTRVQHRGAYQTGIAEIQCMYAPEFNSHSESLALVVK